MSEVHLVWVIVSGNGFFRKTLKWKKNLNSVHDFRLYNVISYNYGNRIYHKAQQKKNKFNDFVYCCT